MENKRLIVDADLKKIVARMVEVPDDMRAKFIGAINRTPMAEPTRCRGCELGVLFEHTPDQLCLEELALAMLAGARAIETNRRCTGAIYIRDPFGENGGPFELAYHTAAEILRTEGERIVEAPRKENH